MFFTIKKDATNTQYFLRDLVFAPLGLKCRILGLICPTFGLIGPTWSPICPTFTGFIKQKIEMHPINQPAGWHRSKSSSRRLVVRPSVGPFVGPLVRSSPL